MKKVKKSRTEEVTQPSKDRKDEEPMIIERMEWRLGGRSAGRSDGKRLIPRDTTGFPGKIKRRIRLKHQTVTIRARERR